MRKEFMDGGIKATGQIESLPDKKVEITSPTAGKIVQLFVEPGDRVQKGEAIAVLSSPELVSLRVESLQNLATTESEVKQAQTNFILAQENYQRQVNIANAEIEQAQNQLVAAQARYQRDNSIVNQGAVVSIAKENYEQQIKIAEAEISQAETELAVAQEQYNQDQKLAETGAIPQRTFLESQAHLSQAKADLVKAKSQRDVLAAKTTIRQSEIDLPVRDLRESETLLATAKTELVKAKQRREVLEAEAEVKRSKAELEATKSRFNLSQTAYETRLRQLGTGADQDGTVTITSPISGVVSHRDITLGQSVDDAGLPIMTIQDNSHVLVTANIYEKDLKDIKVGQRVQVKVSGLENQVFPGKITKISPTVAGESRVIPVWAELDNLEGKLKPGMFAELELITSQTVNQVLSIPENAVVNMSGKNLVYVQNGDGFAPVEVTLGEKFNQKTEIKKGLFEGDQIVIQGALQLYAQSLRGGSQKAEKKPPQLPVNSTEFSLFSPDLMVLPVGGIIVIGAFWLGRRTQQKKPIYTDQFSLSELKDLPQESIGQYCELPSNNHHRS
ncbi:MAG: efflux RND transporter periplasmic adaptor subunit [Planktothrix sp. GU0601_MAG3]|nr:MAG: efflux RND transporter periplasmic adaptor subunit [Planktothrix sp. GU0601_MAG3]